MNHLGGISLPMSSVVRLTDHPDMTIAVYHIHKALTQKQHLRKEFALKRTNPFHISPQ